MSELVSDVELRDALAASEINWDCDEGASIDADILDDGILLIKFAGKIMLADTVIISHRMEEISRFVTENLSHVIFDMSECKHLSSSGVGFLLVCASTMRKRDDWLYLLSPTGTIRRSLSLMGADESLKIVENIDDALRVIG